MVNRPDICVVEVSKEFEDKGVIRRVLDGITFTVPPATFLSIVGPSGCGKTTLLRILLGLERPTSGRVHIDPTQKAQGTAYIQQSSLLLPWRTLLQNASLGLELKGALNEARLGFVQNLIDQYGLSGFEHDSPHQLSGGMQQRVALIRALASGPRLLFCDEPFSSVDFVTRLELNTTFRKLCKIEQITTVLVTHNIEEAMFLGDTVVVMSGRPGRIVGQYKPSFSIGREDAVRCKHSPEFKDLFEEIWGALRKYRASEG